MGMYLLGLTEAGSVGRPRPSRRLPHLVSLFVLLVACSQHTATSDEPWFNPPGGTWTPDADMVLDMKAALDEKLKPFLSESGRASLPATRYWFQYMGRDPNASKYIDIRGRPFPVLPHAADRSYMGPWIPEECIVHARYQPSNKGIDDLVLSGISCPARL